MKRKPGELFYDYCARRLMDKEVTKELMKPRFVHISCVLLPTQDEKYKELPEELRPLVKVKVQGTYRKKKEEAEDAVSKIRS